MHLFSLAARESKICIFPPTLNFLPTWKKGAYKDVLWDNINYIVAPLQFWWGQLSIVICPRVWRPSSKATAQVGPAIHPIHSHPALALLQPQQHVDLISKGGNYRVNEVHGNSNHGKRVPWKLETHVLCDCFFIGERLVLILFGVAIFHYKINMLESLYIYKQT